VDARWLRLYLRLDAHVPGLCHNANALARWVLGDVVPKTRPFIDHVSFGYGIRNALDQDRQLKIEEALSTPPHLNRFEPFDRFAIAYADAEEWLTRKEQLALQCHSAGDIAKVEKLFLEVAEFAGGFLRYGHSFKHLTTLFPIEHNRIMLYSSVALYYLCKIRANLDDSRVHVGDPRACLISAAEHGIIALDLPSPVDEKEWSARICLMLSSIMVALGDLERSTYYVCRAMETIVEVRTEVKQPMNRVSANPVLILLPFQNMPPAKWTLADCILIVRAWEVDLVAKT
jgi:hypothetical protein